MIRSFAWFVLLAWAGASHAQVQVKDAWARPAVQGQTATGAFMSLTSSDGARLIGAASSIAGVVEIHEMVMEGSVMRMRRSRASICRRAAASSSSPAAITSC